MTGNGKRGSALSALLLACALAGLWVAPWAAPQAHAQPFVQEIAPFSVERGDGTPYLNPFSGGLVQPRIGLIDADGNGLPDLFTLNPDNRLRFYRNEGNLRFRRVHPSSFESAPVRSWFRLADIDADGTLDLFTAGSLSEVLLYRNTGTSDAPVFTAPPDTLRHGATKIFTQQETVPSLVDIDADGDLDLFSGNVEGSISFYRNTGTQAAPQFTFVTGNYENILVISGGGAPGGTIGEDEIERDGWKRDHRDRELQRHGASVLDFVDLDRDGDLDILFGDFFTDKLIFFHNTGTPANASFGMDRLDTAFLPNGDIVTSTGFNQPVSGDIDGDGDRDVLVSSLYPLAPDQPVVLYENLSGTTPGMPQMRRRTLDVTSEIDPGSFSAPTFIADAERNGLLVGSSDGSLTYFRSSRNGTQITWREAGRFGTLPNLFQAVPAAGDLDGDGAAEIIIGDANDGRIRLFRFRDGRLENSPWQLDTFRVNQYAAPALVDLEGDNDLDLFVGAGNGQFVYFENTGSRTAPRFERRTPPSPLGTLDVGQNSAITFHDLNGDDRPDAIVAGRARPDQTIGFVRFYLNEGGTFARSGPYPDIITDRNPVPAVLPLPGGIHLFIGQQAGGLLAYRREGSSSSVPVSPENGGMNLTIHPTILGGGNRTITISGFPAGAVQEAIPGNFPGTITGTTGGNIPNGAASLGVFDLLGREVFRGHIDGEAGSTVLRLPDLPEGIYHLIVAHFPVGRFVILD